MHLDDARPGQPLTVLGQARPAAAPGAVTRRLAELGIRPGATVMILSRTSGGGAIIAVGDDRIAVSRQILAGIEVGAEVPAHG